MRYERVTYEAYPRPNMRVLCILTVLALSLFPLSACSGGGGGARQAREKSVQAEAKPVKADREHKMLGDDRRIAVSELTRAEREEITRAWNQFLTRSPLWRISLRSIVDRQGAGAYILSENLFRHFFKASIYTNRAELDRVAASVRVIGEPAAAYFAKPLVENLVPLGKPVIAEVTDPDKPDATIKKTFHHFQIDDFTRRDAARILAAIGPPAVPTLSSDKLLKHARPSGRRYAAMALGKIGDDAAIRTLIGVIETSTDWQDRAAAVQGLGAALRKNKSALAPLEKASQDADPFVRKKADQALAGKTRLPF